jgi:hypothetical protein
MLRALLILASLTLPPTLPHRQEATPLTIAPTRSLVPCIQLASVSRYQAHRCFLVGYLARGKRTVRHALTLLWGHISQLPSQFAVP